MGNGRREEIERHLTEEDSTATRVRQEPVSRRYTRRSGRARRENPTQPARWADRWNAGGVARLARDHGGGRHRNSTKLTASDAENCSKETDRGLRRRRGFFDAPWPQPTDNSCRVWAFDVPYVERELMQVHRPIAKVLRPQWGERRRVHLNRDQRTELSRIRANASEKPRSRYITCSR